MSADSRRASKAWRDDLEWRAQNLLQAQRTDAAAQRQAEVAEQAHAERIAHIQQWQQAWSDANGRAMTPKGLAPPVGFGYLSLATVLTITVVMATAMPHY